MAPDWVPAALSPDLPPGTVMASVCGSTEVAIWRGTGGAVAAWADRCPHRGMRLSHGFVRGDLLSCIYHGWRYDGAGRCRKIPAHPDLEPPATIAATPLPCAEAGGVVWVATTAPAGPPPSFGGAAPLRSLTVEASAETLAAAAGAESDGAVLRARLPGTGEVTMLLQRVGPGRTAVHALVPPAPPERRVAASRALEALRRLAERTAA